MHGIGVSEWLILQHQNNFIQSEYDSCIDNGQVRWLATLNPTYLKGKIRERLKS